MEVERKGFMFVESLAEKYKDKFLVGSVFSPRDFAGDGERFELMKRHFNVLTAENAMKPDAMQPRKDEYNFGIVDEIVKRITDAGIQLHGHTLVWHNQSPPFLNTDVTRAEAEQNLRGHILAVAGHYAGRAISWDVVNEAVSDDAVDAADWRGALRHRNWYNAFAQDGGAGEDYLYLAFKFAREAAPDAVLYYNDYNMDNPLKSTFVRDMVRDLNARYRDEGNERKLIEGVGMQGHYNINTDVAKVAESIEKFAQLGVEISISELDIMVPGAAPTGLTREQELAQAQKTAQLFALFRTRADVIRRVTLWGIDDATSWRRFGYPLLFNGDLGPKLAFFAALEPEKYMHITSDYEGADSEQGEGIEPERVIRITALGIAAAATVTAAAIALVYKLFRGKK